MSDYKQKIDLIGLRCPIPVQRIRSALRDMKKGQRLIVIGDDPESLHDIPKLLERLGLGPPLIAEDNSVWTYRPKINAVAARKSSSHEKTHSCEFQISQIMLTSFQI